MYCAYCGLEHDEGVLRTEEHIVPFGLGGSNRFTIPACHGCNSDLGSDVDAPFLNFFPVRAKRFFLGLESTSGNDPSIDLGGVGWIDGKEVPISYFVRGESKELKIAEPTIVKTQNADGTEHWQVSGDPAQVREIIEGKLRKQLKLGKTMTSEDGQVLAPEDLDSLFAGKETVVQNPSVLKTIPLDPMMPVRFFSKLALAVAHFHLGEEFSRSPSADRLRQHMSATDYTQVELLGGAIWPYVDAIQDMLAVFAKPDHHTLAIVEGRPRYFVASLFGEYGSFVQLDRLDEGEPPSSNGQGIVWRIELPSRQLRRMTTNDLYYECAAEIKQAITFLGFSVERPVR
jgi:hypothetical protein